MRCNFHDAGLQCKTYIPGRDYCDAHSRPPSSPGSSPLAESGVVQNTTWSSRSCIVFRDDGQPCQAAPRNGSDYCIFHDPDYREQRLQNSASGGRACRNTQPVEVDLDIADRAGIQATIDTVIRLEFLGRISPARSRNILRALSTASRNLRWGGDVDRDGYDERTRILNARITDHTDEARDRDTPLEVRTASVGDPSAMPPPPSIANRQSTIANPEFTVTQEAWDAQTRRLRAVVRRLGLTHEQVAARLGFTTEEVVRRLGDLSPSGAEDD